MPAATRTSGPNEFRKLPNWARVAFVARCARRLRSVCQEVEPDCPVNVLAGYDEYVNAIEQAAANARACPQWPPSEFATDWWLHPETLSPISTALHDAIAVYMAVSRLSKPAKTSKDVDFGESLIEYVSGRIMADMRVAADESDHAKEVFSAMRQELRRVQQVASREYWTDATPVPPEFFGPL